MPFRIITILSPVLFSVAFYSAGMGQAHYLLSDTSVTHRLDTHVEVFIDSSGHVSFDQVLKPEFQKRFRASTGGLTYGYLKSTIWLKVQMRARVPHTRWLLEIPAPFLEYVDFYQLSSGNQWNHSVSGYYRRYSEKQFPSTGHVLPLKFGEDSVSIAYVRVGGLSPKTFPVYAIEEARFIEQNRMKDLGYGVFFGILLVMFFYNLFIYAIIRQRSYLYYFCTIVCTFMIFSAISGYGGKFLWPETPVLNYFTGKLSLELLLIFLSLFTIDFLEVRKYSTVMYYALLTLIPLAVVALLLVATNVFPFAGNTLISFSTLLFMAAGIVVKIKGNKTAGYFIAAWTIYLAGGLLISLRNSGFLDYNFWTTHFVEVGAVLQTAVIGFALGHQYRRFKKEKEEAQLQALRIQEEAMAWLEAKVNERTEELSKAYEQLQQTLETNELQTLLIEHKNSELDSFFHRVSHDLKGPISSLLGLTMVAKLEIKDDHALDFFERQHIQLERLSSIVNGLVKLTKLKDAELQTELIDFDKMIDECILSFHSLANFPGVTFRKEVQPGIEFYSEWTLLNGILQNLIENAIKYARGDAPYVRVAVRDESGWVVIEVEDNGQGIAAEHQPRIFDMFYRASQKESGTGLGLYILKRSVDRLKGSIGIKSDVGIGSTFTVRLPPMKEVSHLVEYPQSQD
ncbi:MAG TPA: sensor histidine kinase [Chryseosolibacter sp.]